MEEVWCETCRNFSSDRSSSVGDLMHLTLAFPGVDPQDTYGEPPGTRGEWYIFDNFLGARGGDIVWFWKRTLQTPGMHPQDLVATGQRYMVFKIPDGQLAAICIPFLGSGMFYEEKESLLLPTVSMNSL